MSAPLAAAAHLIPLVAAESAVRTCPLVPTVRVGIDDTAGTPGAAEWLLYDVVVAANDTLSFGPLSLGNTQYLRVSSSANTCTFSAAVAEIS